MELSNNFERVLVFLNQKKKLIADLISTTESLLVIDDQTSIEGLWQKYESDVENYQKNEQALQESLLEIKQENAELEKKTLSPEQKAELLKQNVLLVTYPKKLEGLAKNWLELTLALEKKWEGQKNMIQHALELEEMYQTGRYHQKLKNYLGHQKP